MATVNEIMKREVERRRRELRLTIGDLAKISGLTRQGVARVRNGEMRRYQDSTINGIAAALQWDLNWYEAFKRGDVPTQASDDETDGPEAVSRLDVLERETAALRQAVRELQADVRFLLDDEQRRPSTGDGDGASEAGR